MLRKGFAVEPQSLICLCPGGLVPGSGSVSRKMEAVFARNLFRRAKNSASFDCVRRQASFCMLMGVPWFCSAASTCSPPCKHCPRSVARPVLLGFLDPRKKKATNSSGKCNLSLDTPMAKPKPLSRVLSAKNTWNALAQVWSAQFEEAPGPQC